MMVSALYLNFQRGLDSSEASVCVHACRAIHRYIQMYQTLKVSVAQRLYLQCQLSSIGSHCQVGFDEKESKDMFGLRGEESHNCER